MKGICTTHPPRVAMRLLLALVLVCGWMPHAMALHVVSDAIPDGALTVPPGGSTSLYFELSAGDFLQWTWSEQSGRAAELSTQLWWTDTGGQEHRATPTATKESFGNFDAPGNLAGARLEWRNAGPAVATITWSYYTTAPFWQRPEYFLPAMLPLFLVAAAFYFGRMIDRRRRTGSGHTARSAHLNPMPKENVS